MLTLQKNWLGGYKGEGSREVRSPDRLKEILVPNFDLVEEQDMPILLRETSRKNQWTVAHATVWKRRI